VVAITSFGKQIREDRHSEAEGEDDFRSKLHDVQK
jgi:hypothetical protein